jgi:hypothetical protein
LATARFRVPRHREPPIPLARSQDFAEPVEDPEEVRQAWVRLAVERLEKLERGEAKTVGWDEVRGRLQKILDR